MKSLVFAIAAVAILATAASLATSVTMAQDGCAASQTDTFTGWGANWDDAEDRAYWYADMQYGKGNYDVVGTDKGTDYNHIPREYPFWFKIEVDPLP